MRLDDLDLRELLDYRPEGGLIHFAGRRVVLLDVVALGLLRRELVDRLGIGGARGILTRMGYAHGWRIAEESRALPWDEPDAWRRAGGRFHRLQGLVGFEPIAPSGPDAPFAEALWHDSYEAEQHLRQLGRADEPVCWSLTGFASGYLSRAFDAPIFCVETRCVARGDAACRMVGRRREDWGEAIEAHLPYYEEDCLEEALRATTEALRRTERELGARRRVLARGLPEEDPSGCIAFSPKMRDALALARRAAKVDVTVLVRGETGVGKERLAQLVHEESPRAAGPFVAVNCGAIPASLLESELFGHAKGSFTGATQDRIGLFEAAQGGTLFLDEIGELAPETQVRLLRVLQEREVRRVGETAPRPIDVRVVAATHRDLRADIRAGRFREDLYYRLAVMEIELAPLRERREDVLPLARLFLERASARTRPGEPALGLTPGAADRLLAHGWPGNVRELENAMERAAVVAEGERVDGADLPASVRAATAAEDEAALTLAEAQRRHVERVLEAHGGHRAKTAAALGIGEATLYRMLARWRG